MEMPGIQAGDFVQVRRNPDGGPVEVAEGAATSVTAKSITLGPETYTSENGWTWELIRSSTPLPKRLSEIRAQTFEQLEPIVLIGRGSVWMDELGKVVPVESIRWFEEVEE
jgi:hypothetical protein